MRTLVSIDGSGACGHDATAEFAPLISRVRLSIINGLDREFLEDSEVAALDVSAAQFAILRNVLKSSAQSACELCKSMDYDRGAMSRMIDRLECKQLLRRVPLAHTRRTMALEVTAAGKAAFPKMEACLQRVLKRLFDGISQAQLRETEAVLKRMLANA